MFPDKFGISLWRMHGIEGVLKKELLDLSAQKQEEIALLRNTTWLLEYMELAAIN